MTIQDINQKIQDIQTALSANPEGRAKELLEQGLQTFQSLLLAEQKKTKSQPVEKIKQLPTKAEMQEWANKEEQAQSKARPELNPSLGIPSLNETPEKLSADKRSCGETIKTVKAPEFSMPDDSINIELEDSKGNKQVKTFSKAQVRALARKYFSNVHESWLGKDRKMGVGFKNLLAYVVAWKEFDGALPVLRDVLPDYDRYNRGGEDKEPSEAFKVAQELYGKIVEILTH